MCMLSVIPAGIPADDFLIHELLNGCLTNRDGFGSACIVNGELVIHKSMDAGDALEAFSRNRTRGIDAPAIFHSRWATHGEYGIGNVHPFYYGDDTGTILAHNGIMPRSFHPRNGDPRSDTAKFAAAMPHMGHLDDGISAGRIATVLGRSNKVAVLTVNPAYSSSLYLWGETLGDYSTKTNAWHSNGDYYGMWTYPHSDDGMPDVTAFAHLMGTSELPDACPACHESDMDAQWRVCNVCGWCADCNQFGKDCMCFTGASNRNSVDRNWWNDSDEYVYN